MARFAAVGPLLRAAARAAVDQAGVASTATVSGRAAAAAAAAAATRAAASLPAPAPPPVGLAAVAAITRAAAAGPAAATTTTTTAAAARSLPLWRRVAPGPFGLCSSNPTSAAAAAAAASAASAAAAAGALCRRALPPPSSSLAAAAASAPALTRAYATDFARKQAANPGLKFWKPTSPGQRGRVTVRRDGVWRGKPMRALVKGAKTTAGRNHRGRITCRHRGGGHRRRLREVDFVRTAATGRAGVKGTVQRIEYDPARSAYLALVKYDAAAAGASGAGGARGRAGAAAAAAGFSSFSSSSSASSSSAPPRPAAKEYGYILAPQGLSPGDVVVSAPGGAGGGGSGAQARADAKAAASQAGGGGGGDDAGGATTPVPIKPGNRLALADIPVGIAVHAIELRPGEGGQLCRAAGASAVLTNKQARHAIVRLPSGEQRLVPLACRATVGAVSNPQHKNERLGKAGANRHRGVRPTVRGVAMNPVDHPHGGRTSGGRPSVSPWARPAKGGRTRASGKASDRVILVTRRQASRRGKE